MEKQLKIMLTVLLDDQEIDKVIRKIKEKKSYQDRSEDIIQLIEEIEEMYKIGV